MSFNYSRRPSYHQSEVLGDLPDPDFEEQSNGEENTQVEIMGETSVTRRVLKTQSIPSNVDDSSALVTATLMAQRRSNSEAKRGEDWADINSFVMSRLHANENAKLELGPNQTKRLFLHLARRYKEEDTLAAVLSEVDITVIEAGSVGAETVDALQRLASEIPDPQQGILISRLLGETKGNPEVLKQLVTLAESDPSVARLAAASLNLGRYTDAIEELRRQIDANSQEHAFQASLQRNPWMFGSEYSERIARRDWIRDQQTDFMMRRTADSYLELIEIKRPLNGQSLFNYDRSHNSWYPQANLSQVIGQVIGYIDQLDAKRNDIFFDDGERVNKIRAKIVMGRDVDQDQVDALRRLNGHLHRIEVITFDQLMRTACRVREHLQEVLEPMTGEVDAGWPPF